MIVRSIVYLFILCIIIATRAYCLDFIGFCNCNLLKDSCDPNCCCDSDCTIDDRQLFTACSTAYRYEFPQSCTQTAVLYKDFSPYTRNSTSRDIFCVQSDRYIARNFYSTPPVNSNNEASVAAAIDVKNMGFSFGDVTSDLDPTSVRPAKYRINVPVQVLNGNGASGFLVHPRPSNSISCSYASPALFLDSSASQCATRVTNTSCENDTTINLINFISDFRVARQPDVLKSVRPDYVGVDLVTLKNTSIVCYDIAGTMVTCPEEPEPFLNEEICENVLSLLTYSIKFDPIVGILEVTYKAELRAIPLFNVHINATDNVTNDTSEFAANSGQYNLVQKFGLTYTFSSKGNSTEDAPYPRSGNPGYLLGRPLISRQRLNGTTIRAGPLITLPTIHSDGTCADDAKIAGQPVNFGENLRHSCIRRLTWDAGRRSLRTSCTILNEEIKASLAGLGINNDLQVAMFGNSSESSAQDWISVHNSSCGGGPRNTETACEEMILGARLEFWVLKIGSFSNPQSTLTGAILTCEKGKILFQCAAGSCVANSTMKFLTSYTVAFTDVTQAPLEGAKRRPMYFLRLPADFFKPLFNHAGSTSQTVGLLRPIFHLVMAWNCQRVFGSP